MHVCNLLQCLQEVILCFKEIMSLPDYGLLRAQK